MREQNWCGSGTSAMVCIFAKTIPNSLFLPIAPNASGLFQSPISFIYSIVAYYHNQEKKTCKLLFYDLENYLIKISFQLQKF